MTKFFESAEADEFIASADFRETSKEVMTAISFFARNTEEAAAIWNGDAIDVACSYKDIWEYATNNGMDNDVNLSWGGDSNWGCLA